MDTLARQVRVAQRRLVAEQFLRALGWCLGVALGLALLLIAVDKVYPAGPNGWKWLIQHFGYTTPPWLNVEFFAWIWLGTALVLGLTVAIAWTWRRHQSLLEAAIELDRRFNLRERVSSSLSLTNEERETEAGRALLEDALRRVQKLEVTEQFSVRPGRWSLLPLLPGALAVLVALFVPQRSSSQAQANTAELAAIQKKIKKEQQTLHKRLEQRRKKAQEAGLKEADNLFEKMERELKEQQAKGELDQKSATVKLNDLSDELEKRRKELGSAEKLRQQFNDLRPSQGPAEKLGQALKKGDFKQAQQEMEKLKDQLSKGKLSPEQREQLAKQMNEMQQRMREQVEKHRQAKQELEQQIQQKRQQGQMADADKLQQQLDNLKQMDKQMQRMEQMAEKMGQCEQCMKEGKGGEAAKALEEMQAQLEGMKGDADEAQMLEEALDEIAQAKQGMNGNGKKGNRPGRGLGEGRGEGDRPEEETDTKYYNTNAKQKPKGGQAVVTGFVDGPNIRGDVKQEIRAQVEGAKADQADPLTGQRLPREYRDHARDYFDRLREGPGGGAAEPEEAPAE